MSIPLVLIPPEPRARSNFCWQQLDSVDSSTRNFSNCILVILNFCSVLVFAIVSHFMNPIMHLLSPSRDSSSLLNPLHLPSYLFTLLSFPSHSTFRSSRVFLLLVFSFSRSKGTTPLVSAVPFSRRNSTKEKRNANKFVKLEASRRRRQT